MSDCSQETIEKNHQIIKQRIHPKRNSGSLESKERFEELKKAYDVLKDPELRARYDNRLEQEAEQGGGQEAEQEKISNLYILFGVLSDSHPELITKSYRSLLSRLHPDNNDNSRESNDRTAELIKAFKALANPRSRLEHDAALRRSYTLPRFRGEREQRQKDLKEETHIRQASAERARATEAGERKNSEERARAAEAGKRQNSEEWYAAAWNKQVFELARELEEDGQVEEAVSWYRMLALEDHPEAAFRLALLVEGINIKEALYRHAQAQKLDKEGEITRQSVLRMAWLYQGGVSREGETLLPPDPEKAAELYKKALGLGVSPGEIAKQYEEQEAYQEALEWLNKEGAALARSSGSQSLRADAQEKNFDEKNREETKAGQSVSADADIHLAIQSQDKQSGPGSPSTKGKFVIDMIHRVHNVEADINVRQVDSGKTPLHLAVERLYSPVIDLLLELGANVNIPDREGNTVLAHALINWRRNGPHKVTFRYYDFRNRIKERLLLDFK